MIEEDEIDLRPYVSALLRRWKLIIGITAAAAVAAAAISLATPVSYEATSTVAVATLGSKPVPDAKTYLDLATSEGMRDDLAKTLSSSPGGATLDANDLKSRLTAVAGSDPSIIVFKVVDTDPGRAASIAKAWSNLFVQVAASIFNPAKDSYDQLQAQLTRSRSELRQAEEQLASIETSSQVGVLQTQLSAQQNNLASLYASKAALQIAEENASSLQTRLQQAPPGARADASDDTTITLIQSSILGVSTQFQLTTNPATADRTLQPSLAGAPVQLQLPAQGDRPVSSQLEALQGVTTLIRDRGAGADKQIAALQPSITDLSTKVSQILIEQGSLIAQRDGQRAASKDLETRTSQAKATLDAGTGQPRVVSEARAATAPLARGTTKNVAVAVVLGLMGGIAIAFGAEYLQSRRQPLKGIAQPAIQS